MFAANDDVDDVLHVFVVLEPVVLDLQMVKDISRFGRKVMRQELFKLVGIGVKCVLQQNKLKEVKRLVLVSIFEDRQNVRLDLGIRQAFHRVVDIGSLLTINFVVEVVLSSCRIRFLEPVDEVVLFLVGELLARMILVGSVGFAHICKDRSLLLLESDGQEAFGGLVLELGDLFIGQDEVVAAISGRLIDGLLPLDRRHHALLLLSINLDDEIADGLHELRIGLDLSAEVGVVQVTVVHF